MSDCVCAYADADAGFDSLLLLPFKGLYWRGVLLSWAQFSPSAVGVYFYRSPCTSLPLCVLTAGIVRACVCGLLGDLHLLAVHGALKLAAVCITAYSSCGQMHACAAAAGHHFWLGDSSLCSLACCPVWAVWYGLLHVLAMRCAAHA